MWMAVAHRFRAGIFAVIWKDTDLNTFFGGVRLGKVSYDPCGLDFLGADVADAASNSAELSGLIWAHLFCIQFCSHQVPSSSVARGDKCRCTIFYDSMLAAHSMDSTWKSTGTLSEVATGIHNLLDVIADVNLFHEHGHSGHPWNECVDSLCTYYAKHQEEFDAVSEYVPAKSLVFNVKAAQWLFVLALDQYEASQYPVLDAGDDVYLSTFACQISDLAIDSKAIAANIDGFQAEEIAAAGTG